MGRRDSCYLVRVRTLPVRTAVLLFVCAALVGAHGPARALLPEQVLVVANRNARASMDLASYYMQRRKIPERNLLGLWAADAEACSRETYESQIAAPVRRRLAESGGRLRAAVLLYGVPLRIGPPDLDPERAMKIAVLEGERQELAKRRREGGEVAKRLEAVGSEIDVLRRVNEEASVDSELALVRVPGHPVPGWVRNPLFVGWGLERPAAPKPEDVLLISRLDGPTEAVVRRVVDDSLAAEAAGLSGTAYLDARWKDPAPGKELDAYGFYDKSLHEAAAGLKARGIPVVLDEAEALFAEGSRLPAALYCGWYSFGRYVGAFRWRKGAVAYHIASGECVTLKGKSGTGWCKRLLEEGVAATLGPVGEPYVQAFPPPSLFWLLLTDGRFTLAEAYGLSLPYLSWKMVLLGDPLYRPFRPKATGLPAGSP